VLIVDPGASNSLGNFREAPYYAFSHSLGQYLTLALPADVPG
jgi:hypothetical protein